MRALIGLVSGAAFNSDHVSRWSVMNLGLSFESIHLRGHQIAALRSTITSRPFAPCLPISLRMSCEPSWQRSTPGSTPTCVKRLRSSTMTWSVSTLSGVLLHLPRLSLPEPSLPAPTQLLWVLQQGPCVGEKELMSLPQAFLQRVLVTEIVFLSLPVFLINP